MGTQICGSLVKRWARELRIGIVIHQRGSDDQARRQQQSPFHRFGHGASNQHSGDEYIIHQRRGQERAHYVDRLDLRGEEGEQDGEDSEEQEQGVGCKV